MASEKLPLSYKGHPLRRKDNLIYYGTMAEKYIIMLQILDDGHITDAQGRKADFKNAIVVLTSNVGAARITAKGSKLGFSATERRDGETRPIEELKAAVLDDLKKVFRPEFLNRLD